MLQTKNVTARMIQLQKYSSLSYLIYIEEWQLPVVQKVIMKMHIAETEMKMWTRKCALFVHEYIVQLELKGVSVFHILLRTHSNNPKL